MLLIKSERRKRKNNLRTIAINCVTKWFRRASSLSTPTERCALCERSRKSNFLWLLCLSRSLIAANALIVAPYTTGYYPRGTSLMSRRFGVLFESVYALFDTHTSSAVITFRSEPWARAVKGNKNCDVALSVWQPLLLFRRLCLGLSVGEKRGEKSGYTGARP